MRASDSHAKPIEQNGLSNGVELMVDVDEQLDNKVVSIANGLVNESNKIARLEERRDDEQENHKVVCESDKLVVDGDKAIESGDDEQVRPYLDLFVDTLVSNVTPMEK